MNQMRFKIVGQLEISLTRDEIQQWQREGKGWILREGLIEKSRINELLYLLRTRYKKRVRRPAKWRPYPEWTAYKKLVIKLTGKQPIDTLENYHLRGWNGYHLDHKVSIWYGFENGIQAERIAHISNLQFIPAKENRKKGVDCVFT